MPLNRWPRNFSLVANVFVSAFLLTIQAGASETVIYRFTGNGDGGRPYGGLVLDRFGNLYGTTQVGGDPVCSCGTVFRLSPSRDGWVETVLYQFKGEAANDGRWPMGTLAFDKAGSLVGTTQFGGAYASGTVFQLKPTSNGTWEETILYAFSGNPDGLFPEAGVIIDTLGNLYGTTAGGGSQNFGIVFEISPTLSGWEETILHDFSIADGAGPQAGLAEDNSGNLWGVAQAGGTNYAGSVFELSTSGGLWTFQVIHSFNMLDGDQPESNVVISTDGTVYGTTVYGGVYDGGTLWRLKQVDGAWQESVIHSFTGTRDGGQPMGLTIAKGMLIGTTIVGGGQGCSGIGCGMVYTVKPRPGGGEIGNLLYGFTDLNGDGANPYDAVTVDQYGHIFGVTEYGGDPGGCDGFTCGTVFEIVPQAFTWQPPTYSRNASRLPKLRKPLHQPTSRGLAESNLTALRGIV